ncbi:MAG: N-acetyltransferase [Clostridia bacterium]|nr:N-acetyltransferase [Clostridia bacterium]
MIEIVEVKTKKQWEDFADFPIKYYKKCPYYVPSFRDDDINMANEKKNFSCIGCDVKAFLAYKDGVLAGRIAGVIVRESNRLYNQKNIRFNRFDFIEDEEVAKALLKAVASFGKEKGMEVMHGPWGFNDTDREGMLIYGFDKVSTYATNFNYPYYPEFMRKFGFNDESVWLEQKFTVPEKDDENYTRFVKLGAFVKNKYELRELTEEMSFGNIVKNYGDKFFDCFNAAYSKLDMYVEIGGEAKKVVLKQFATALNPRYVSVLADKNDDVVAFGVVMPAIGQAIKKHDGKQNLPFVFDFINALNHPKALELTLVAVRPEYSNLGYSAACFGKILKNIVDDGITEVVSDPTLETNTAVRAQWEQVPHETIKKRQTFTKQIDDVLGL